MEKKQQVAAFAWEPAGDRFALVLGDVPKLEVTFYTMKVRTWHNTATKQPDTDSYARYTSTALYSMSCHRQALMRCAAPGYRRAVRARTNSKSSRPFKIDPSTTSIGRQWETFVSWLPWAMTWGRTTGALRCFALHRFSLHWAIPWCRNFCTSRLIAFAYSLKSTTWTFE